MLIGSKTPRTDFLNSSKTLNLEELFEVIFFAEWNNYQVCQICCVGLCIIQSLNWKVAQKFPANINFPSHFQPKFPPNCFGFVWFPSHFNPYIWMSIKQIPQTRKRMASSSSTSKSNQDELTMEYYINATHCVCPKPLPVILQTAWTPKNPGRRFKACPIWVRLLSSKTNIYI